MFKMLFKGKINANTLKQSLYALVIALIYFMFGMINFTKLEFEPERLLDKNYWIQYFLTVGLGLVLMLLSTAYRKESLKGKEDSQITDMQNLLGSLKMSLIDNSLYDNFAIYIKEQNTKEKISKYRAYLSQKRDKAKKAKQIEKYNNMLAETHKPNFDIDKVKVRLWILPIWIKIRIRELTVNVIFSVSHYEKNGEQYFYSGRENYANWVLPSLIISMFFSGLMLSIALNSQSTTNEQIKNFIMAIGTSLTYLIRGFSYADYSINTVLYGVLENRAGFARQYLNTKGLTALIQNNDLYKYKINIEQEQDQAKETEENG